MVTRTTEPFLAEPGNLFALQFVLKIAGGKATPVFITDGLADLLGIAGAAPPGERWLAPWLHSGDVAAALPDYATLAAEQEVECLLRLIQPQGTYRWIRQTCRLHGPGTAEEYSIAGLLVDGTRQHEQQAAELRYKNFAELAADWYWEQDENFCYTYFSREFVKITGVSLSLTLGKTRWDALGSLDSESVDWAGHIRTHEAHLPFRNFEYPSQRGNRPLWFRVSGRPKFDEDGRFLGYVGVAAEVSAYKHAETENLTRLAQIVDGSPVATFILDREHRVTCWNHACEVLTGVSATSVMGTSKQWQPFYPSERPVMADLIVDGESGREVSRHYFDKWQRSELIKGAYEAEDFFPHFGAGGRWVYFTAAPLRDENGKITGAIETLQDVTERRVAEAALKQKAEEEALRTASYFQEVLTNLPFGVLVLDKELKAVFWNRQAESLFDLAEGFIHKDISIRKIVRQIAENGCYGPGDIEEQIASRCEKLFRFQAHSVELARPGGGTLLVRGSPVMIADVTAGFILLQEDITERKQDEQRTRERDMEKSLAVLRHTVGNISQGISMFDAELNLAVWNQLFLELHDFPESLARNGTPFEAFARHNAERGEYGPGDVEALTQARLRQARQLTPHLFERERPDGRIIEIFGKPLPDGSFVSTYTDITLRKRSEIALREFNTTLEHKITERTAALESALRELGTVIENLEQTQDDLVRSEKLAALGSMVAGVAHELNTPIGNSLMVASHLVETSRKMNNALKTGLKKSMLDEFLADTGSASDVLVRNLNKAAELVSSFKQVAVDQTSSQRRSFNLAEMLSEVMTSLGPTIRKTPYLIEQDIAECILLESFPGPLGQVVTNLINNGIIHGFDGRENGRIRIEARKPAEGNGQVVLKITDDGKGIPADVLPRIFDPFFTTRLGQGGSGLGLNIVHNIVSSILGGRITAESVAGAGACFTLVLPLTAPEQGSPQSKLAAHTASQAAPGAPTGFQSGEGI
jgi:PAS domain S-box-containing protein